MCNGEFGVLRPEIYESCLCSLGVGARFSLDLEKLLSWSNWVMVPLVPGLLALGASEYVGPKSIVGRSVENELGTVVDSGL